MFVSHSAPAIDENLALGEESRYADPSFSIFTLLLHRLAAERSELGPELVLNRSESPSVSGKIALEDKGRRKPLWQLKLKRVFPLPRNTNPIVEVGDSRCVLDYWRFA